MRSNRSLALSLAALAAGMVMLAFASVPLYRLFCAVTGFGGTPRITAAAPAQAGSRIITVRFNADIAPGLPWEFTPDARAMQVKIGTQTLTSYRVRNTAPTAVTAHATYNVVPEKAGAYFAKVECFCFQNQSLKAGQEAHLPVSFFIDPAFESDPAMDDVRIITLSYTFFTAKK